jgi:hypothetical protein
MTSRSNPSTPFFWWGPVLESRPVRSLYWLVEQGMLSEAVASLIAVAVAGGGSMAVVAEPAAAGKTTLLTAALAHLPPDCTPIFLRGGYESFVALADPLSVPSRSVLLVNEISPFHPAYLWGNHVAQVLIAARQGRAVFATAHVADGPELIALLARPPLSLPASTAAVFDLVAAVEVAGNRRQVSGIWAIVGQRGAAEAIWICDGFSPRRQVLADLRRAVSHGWNPSLEIPDEASLAGAAERLDAVYTLADEPLGPGAMFDRAEHRRSREGAGSP